MRSLRLAKPDAAQKANDGGRADRGFGRYGRREPLSDRDEGKEKEGGRGRNRTGRSAMLLASLAFALGATGCWASGPVGTHNAPGNDQNDSESESDTEHLQDAGLPLCAGEIDADKEEFLLEGRTARLTKSGHKLWVDALDAENGSVDARITDLLWNQIGDGMVFSDGSPVLTLELDGETFSLVFCGIVETDDGLAAQFRITRPNGFVHCNGVDCGNESVPLAHVVDASSTETIIAYTHSEGEIPDNDYEGDCIELVRTMRKQSLSFAAPLPTQNNLDAAEAKTLALHDLDDGTLIEIEMDLLEVDGAAGTARVGVPLASGNIYEGGTLVAGDLAVTREEGYPLPGFSYEWLLDPDALIWETPGASENEKEVNVQADGEYHPFVTVYTSVQGDGGVHLRAFKKEDVQLLKQDEEAKVGSRIYTAEITTGENQDIVAIELEAQE